MKKNDEIVKSDDVDDIIGIAEQLKERDTETLTVDDMVEIAGELDIEVEYVEKAIHHLKHQRLAEQEKEKQAQIRWQKYKKLGAVALAVAFALFLLGGIVTQSSLSSKFSEVKTLESKVVSALERQKKILERYGTRSDVDADGAIDGAENRVRLAKRHYDEAVGTYNKSANRIWAKVWAGFLAYPSRISFSSAIEEWK